jgi:hypothetical protein
MHGPGAFGAPAASAARQRCLTGPLETRLGSI